MNAELQELCFREMHCFKHMKTWNTWRWWRGYWDLCQSIWLEKPSKFFFNIYNKGQLFSKLLNCRNIKPLHCGCKTKLLLRNVFLLRVDIRFCFLPWDIGSRGAEKYFRRGGRLNWPEGAVSRESIRAVKKLDRLKVWVVIVVICMFSQIFSLLGRSFSRNNTEESIYNSSLFPCC